MAMISSKGIYGLAAMVALYRHGCASPIQSRQIAQNGDISQNYLDQLLGRLRKAGLVKSVRGPKGGYLLSREAEKITIKEILLAVEDELQVVDIAYDCSVLSLFFKDIQEKMLILFSLSLADLDTYQETYNEYLHFSI
jgi:Rrf2 family protein